MNEHPVAEKLWFDIRAIVRDTILKMRRDADKRAVRRSKSAYLDSRRGKQERRYYG